LASLRSSEPVQPDPLQPGYPFNVHLVAGMTPIVKHGDLDFWIDRPQGLKGYILNITVKGTGLVFPGSPEELRVRRGDLMLIPAKAIHDYGRAPEAETWFHRWVYFQPRVTWHGLMNWEKRINRTGFLGTHDSAQTERLDHLFKEVEGVSKSDTLFGEDLAHNLLEQILLRCCELFSHRPRVTVDERILRVCHYVHENLGNELNVEELAAVACMSGSRLSHIFKDQMGLTLRQWIEDQRLNLSRQLLITTNLAINQIALHLGYQDALYFSRVFRKRVGISPKEYRREYV
jgi:AraC family transcriptional regulator, arabinose operon regulatory protein